MYPQLMTAAHKAESEQEDQPHEGVQVRSSQSEEKDSIVSLKEPIAQLWVAVQRPLRTKPVTLNSQEVKEMVMEISVIPEVKLKIKTMVRDMTARGLNIFNTRAGDIALMSVQAPL